MFDFIAMPLGWVLGQFFSLTGSYGIAIILLTIFVRILLLPIYTAQVKSQKSMSAIQPEIQKLNKKYKNDKEKLAEETMKLYKEYGVNPLAGCLPLLIQFPIILGLFAALRDPAVFVFGGSKALADAANAQHFLWVHNLGLPDLLSAVVPVDFAKFLPGLLPILAGALTYLSFKTMPQTMDTSANEGANKMMSNMQIIMPLIIVYSGMTLAAGITLYWVVSTAFQILQQLMMTRYSND